ncbi:MAG TPA: HdeD family acid-resistance protein, partial [Thermomicrobiales bacterium]|nr:HdeD family acid-resistance protein [Thermomicrobiales bacterium]
MIILVRNWWSLVLRGVLAVLFGVVAILWPDITLGALIILFGAFALVDGVFAIAGAINQAGDVPRWWVLLLQGLAGVVSGILAFVWPDLTALALLYIIAAWAVVTGVLEIVAAIRLRQEIEGEWLMGLAGLMTFVFGLLLIVFPGSGAVALVWLIGAYAIAT